jgi:hypothetical protein
MTPILLPSAISLLNDQFVERHHRQPSVEEMNNLTKIVRESCAELCDALKDDDWFQQTPAHEFVGLVFETSKYKDLVKFRFRWVHDSLEIGSPSQFELPQDHRMQRVIADARAIERMGRRHDSQPTN